MMDYEAMLRRENVPALGCTEPIACAYAAAWAASVLPCKPDRIEVEGSRNMLKNAMSVGIPGSDMVGLPIAAALGAVGGNHLRELEVLAELTPEKIAESREMVLAGKVTVRQKQDVESLYIEVKVTGGGHTATAIVRRYHTQLTDLTLDGRALRHERLPEQGSASAEELGMSVRGIYEYCTTADTNRLKFLLDGAKLNLRMAEEGLNEKCGINVGKCLADAAHHKRLFGEDIGSRAVAATAAACDARMAGARLPVMSVAGSGNQGMVCTIPVAVYAEGIQASEEQLIRALAVSELITIHIKSRLGRLSALCGCGIAAAVGTSCGVVLLLGGGEKQIEYAITNMVANITGMICDGAKAGCAMKVATAVSAGIQCAVLVMNDVCVPPIDGIVDSDIEKTIANLGYVGREGMAQTDQVILDLMTGKTISTC